MIPDELMKDLEILKEQGYIFNIVEESPKIYIEFKEYPLPAGIYNIEKVDLLIFTTPHYPNAGFDMFWVEPKLTLKNNGQPKAAETFENHLGKSWRRFSYHPYNTKPWNPSEDSVVSFMGYVLQRLQKGD
jgi:hypothetical protein